MLEKDVSVDTLTRTYIKIRAKRAELSSEFKKSDDVLQNLHYSTTAKSRV